MQLCQCSPDEAPVFSAPQYTDRQYPRRSSDTDHLPLPFQAASSSQKHNPSRFSLHP